MDGTNVSDGTDGANVGDGAEDVQRADVTGRVDATSPPSVVLPSL